MRGELQQIHSGPGAVYRFLRGERELLRVSVKPHPFRLEAVFEAEGREICRLVGGDRLYLRAHPELRTAGERSNYICGIFGPGGDCIGRVAQVLPPLVFGPYHFRLELSGQIWEMYEVGLGGQGIKLPVYRDGRQAALAEKDPVVKNNLDVYDLSLREEEDLTAAVILTVFYDWKEFRGRGEFNSRKTSVTRKVTMNRQTNSRHDPAFRESCDP